MSSENNLMPAETSNLLNSREDVLTVCIIKEKDVAKINLLTLLIIILLDNYPLDVQNLWGDPDRVPRS